MAVHKPCTSFTAAVGCGHCHLYFDHAAPLSTPLGEALRPLLEPLGQLLYDLLRPRFVQLADMDLLAELIDILQHEVGTKWTSGNSGPRMVHHYLPASVAPWV